MGSLQASLRYFVLFQMLSSLLISKVIGDNNFIDCSISCTLSSSYPVKQSNQAAFVILPAVFTMTFQYQVSSSPSSSVLANIFDIYSYPLAKSILSLSMEAGSNQMHINYNNTNVMAYGPGVTYSSSQFTTFTLSISPRLVTLSNGVYSLSNNLAGVVLGSNCAIYISTNSLSSTSVNAGGTVKNIQFTGKFFLIRSNNSYSVYFKSLKICVIRSSTNWYACEGAYKCSSSVRFRTNFWAYLRSSAPYLLREYKLRIIVAELREFG